MVLFTRQKMYVFRFFSHPFILFLVLYKKKIFFEVTQKRIKNYKRIFTWFKLIRLWHFKCRIKKMIFWGIMSRWNFYLNNVECERIIFATSWSLFWRFLSKFQEALYNVHMSLLPKRFEGNQIMKKFMLDMNIKVYYA